MRQTVPAPKLANCAAGYSNHIHEYIPEAIASAGVPSDARVRFSGLDAVTGNLQFEVAKPIAFDTLSKIGEELARLLPPRRRPMQSLSEPRPTPRLRLIS